MTPTWRILGLSVWLVLVAWVLIGLLGCHVHLLGSYTIEQTGGTVHDPNTAITFELP